MTYSITCNPKSKFLLHIKYFRLLQICKAITLGLQRSPFLCKLSGEVFHHLKVSVHLCLLVFRFEGLLEILVCPLLLSSWWVLTTLSKMLSLRSSMFPMDLKSHCLMREDGLFPPWDGMATSCLSGFHLLPAFLPCSSTSCSSWRLTFASM